MPTLRQLSAEPVAEEKKKKENLFTQTMKFVTLKTNIKAISPFKHASSLNQYITAWNHYSKEIQLAGVPVVEMVLFGPTASDTSIDNDVVDRTGDGERSSRSRVPELLLAGCGLLFSSPELCINGLVGEELVRVGERSASGDIETCIEVAERSRSGEADACVVRVGLRAGEEGFDR
jgi:hypothetical protein